MKFSQISLDKLTESPKHFIAAALLVTTDGRYLFQLRDDKHMLPLRNHWALFGGAVEPGEDGHAAILREIQEELNYTPTQCTWYHEAIYVLPRRENRVVRKVFFKIPVALRDVETMILSEGSDMRLMTIAELTGLPRIAPWDLSVVLMHGREETIFPDGW